MSAQADPDQRIPIVDRPLPERIGEACIARRIGPDVVDQKIEAAGLFLGDTCEQVDDLLIVGVIALHGNSVTTAFGDLRCGAIEGAVGADGSSRRHVHRPSVASQGEGNALADAPAGTGYECNFSVRRHRGPPNEPSAISASGDRGVVIDHVSVKWH